MKKYLYILIISWSCSAIVGAGELLQSSEFQSPPPSACVSTWWHWMGGHITRAGITADLESMKRQGIAEAAIINIGEYFDRPVDLPKIKFNSPQWMEMYQWALQEADRLGITIGIQTIDGFSTAGGPWITPEMSMKQYVWSRTFIDGGRVELRLAPPVQIEHFYRDYAVVAYPTTEVPNSFQQAGPRVNVNRASAEDKLTDGNPKSVINLRPDDVIDIQFAHDVSADRVAFYPYLPFCWDDIAKISTRFVLSSSEDGIRYNQPVELQFVGANKSLPVAMPLTKARFFRLEYVNNNFLYFSDYPLAEVELLNHGEQPTFSPQITSFFEKAASVRSGGENATTALAADNQPAIAADSIVDITRFMDADGVLRWQAPPGRWGVIRFGYTSTGVTNNPANPEGTGLEADKMDTAAINLHFNSYAQKLIDLAGPFKGKTLRFILMDSWEAQFQTWSTHFGVEFKKRRGYDIIPYIPVLCGETVGSVQMSEAFLHDFRWTIAELIGENYYRHFSELCHRNQLELHGEVINGNWGGLPPLDCLQWNRYMDVPMTEFWAAQDDDQQIAYQPANRPQPGFPTYAAFAFDKQFIGSEAYTGYAHYSETPFRLKPFGDAAYCAGVNQMILHSYVHQPTDRTPGMTLGKFGAAFNRNNPIWEYSRDWLEYQARIQYVLQQGKTVVDVLFYIGDELPQLFSTALLEQLPYGYSATVCHFDMLQQAHVSDGRIITNGSSFPLLLLPNSRTMNFATLQRIAQLVSAGAVVYGPKPDEMLSLADLGKTAAFQQLVNELWGTGGANRYGRGRMISGIPLKRVVEQLGLLPDVATDRNDPQEIMFIHKRVGDADVYFLFNQQNERLDRNMLFRVRDMTPELWNPEDGTVVEPAVYVMEPNHTRIPLAFRPYESKIVVFKNDTPDRFIAQVYRDGQLIFPAPPPGPAAVPAVIRRNGAFEMTDGCSGDYRLIDNRHKTLAMRLEDAAVFELSGSRTEVEFLPAYDADIAPIHMTSLRALSGFDDPAIRYFGGRVKYTIPFTLPSDFAAAADSVVLDLGNFCGDAEVKVNKQLLGYAWNPYATLNVSGLLGRNNILEITAAVPCRNRLIGDLVQYGEVRHLWTTSPIADILHQEMALQPAGLTGPLRLVKYVRHRLP